MMNGRTVPVLICPVRNCEWRIYKHFKLTKRDVRRTMIAHIHTHRVKQFTMAVFLWRQDAKRWN